MRTIIILILYVILAVLSIPAYLIEFIIRKINPMAAAKVAQVIVKRRLQSGHVCFRLPKNDRRTGPDPNRPTRYVCSQPSKLL